MERVNKVKPNEVLRKEMTDFTVSTEGEMDSYDGDVAGVTASPLTWKLG